MAGINPHPPSSPPQGEDGRPLHPNKKKRSGPEYDNAPDPSATRSLDLETSNSRRPNPATFALEPTSATYFYIHSLSDTPASKINALLLKKCFDFHGIGEVPSVKRLRSGDLLVQVLTPNQARSLSKIQTIHDVKVAVTAPVHLNTCKGVVSSDELELLSEADIVALMAKDGVVAARKLRKNPDRRQTAILTFALPRVPDRVKVGWDPCKCRVYVPRPMRCFKCQRYGHSETSCRSQVPVCANCSSKGHSASSCTSASAKCAACEGPHPSSDRSCETWKKECEISRLRAEERLSYWEARTRVEGTPAATPTPGVSYLAVAKASSVPGVSVGVQTSDASTNTPHDDLYPPLTLPVPSPTPSATPALSTTAATDESTPLPSIDESPDSPATLDLKITTDSSSSSDEPMSDDEGAVSGDLPNISSANPSHMDTFRKVVIQGCQPSPTPIPTSSLTVLSGQSISRVDQYGIPQTQEASPPESHGPSPLPSPSPNPKGRRKGKGKRSLNKGNDTVSTSS